MIRFDLKRFVFSEAGQNLMEMVWYAGPGLFLVTNLLYPTYIVYISYSVMVLFGISSYVALTTRFPNTLDTSGTLVQWEKPKERHSPPWYIWLLWTVSGIIHLTAFGILTYVVIWSFVLSFQGTSIEGLVELTFAYYALLVAAILISHIDREFNF